MSFLACAATGCSLGFGRLLPKTNSSSGTVRLALLATSRVASLMGLGDPVTSVHIDTLVADEPPQANLGGQRFRVGPALPIVLLAANKQNRRRTRRVVAEGAKHLDADPIAAPERTATSEHLENLYVDG